MRWLQAEADRRLLLVVGWLIGWWVQADFITVHTPLTPDTRNLMNSATFEKMKKGVHIINCARGGIINEDDLLAALESGKVRSSAGGQATKRLGG